MITSNNTTNNTSVSSIDLTRPIQQCSPLVPDILNIIFSQSDIKSLGNLSSVSKEWHVQSGKDINWQAYKTEFNVEGPNIKAKIKASMPTIDELFNEIFTETDKEILNPGRKVIVRDLVKVLFQKENIRSISIEKLPSGEADKKWFTLNMKEVKQIDFNNRDIYSIVVPKKVLFSLNEYGIDFIKQDYKKCTREHFPIEINNKRLSFGINKCMNININFENKFEATCLYESKFLAYSFENFKADITLLKAIKK